MYTYSKKCCKYKKLPKRVQRGKMIVYGEVVGTRFYEVGKENIKKETEKTTHRVYTRVMEINLGNNVGEATFGN